MQILKITNSLLNYCSGVNMLYMSNCPSPLGFIFKRICKWLKEYIMLRIILNNNFNHRLLNTEYKCISSLYHTKSDIYGHIADARKDIPSTKSMI